MYSLRVLEARNLKSRCQQSGFLLEALRENLPQPLSQARAPPAQVWAAAGEIVEAVLADPCCKTNPVPVEDYLVRRVLEEVTGNF